MSLKRMQTGYPDVVAVEASDKITKEDYEKELVPILKEAKEKQQKINFLFFMGPTFQRYSIGAIWEDLKLSFKYLRTFGKCAVVTDVPRIRRLFKMITPLVPFPVNVYSNEFMDGAIKWVGEKNRAQKGT